MRNTFSILCFLLIFSQCGEPKGISIQGFWKVKQISKEGRPAEFLYAQINDSLLQYWYEGTNYLLPYGYKIENDHLIIWLHNDPNSRQANVGILKSTGKSGFTLEHESQWLEFQEVPFEEFEEDTGQPWRKFDEK